MPAPGREAISFAHLSSTNASGQEDVSIVPSDAQPLLANGLLDPALFNVTELVRQGLATPDAGGAAIRGAASDAAGLPLIVTFAPTRASIAPLLLTAAKGVQQGHELPSISGVAVADGKGAAGAFWNWLTGGGGAERTAALAAGTASSPGLQAGVAKVWLDARAQTMLDQSGPQIGVPRARALGLTGTGVTVAVLDSGIKADHPDLVGRIAESRDFTNTLPDASDDVGHGTHVAGIIGGTGAASAGLYEGVAPGVTLINGKVCVVFGCPFSAIIAGMEWAAPRARVINMSLGGPPSDGTDPMSLALDNLTAQHGTLFIVAAGNSGRPQTVSSPASAREALAVGSVTKQDTLSPFSSQGPRVGDFAIKPDLAAPGSSIVSARVPGTEVGDFDPVDDNYVRVSGTSMATPQVVGAAALLLQQHPDWTGAQVRAALTSSTAPLPGLTVFQQGAGRLDVGRAATQSVFASGTASFGLIPWPHDRPATTHTVTYANYGSESVTLDLALLVTDGQGLPAPDGMFTVTAGTVTVPAQGTADAQVTLTPANRTIGTFSGRLIATSGTTRVVTAVGAVQEVESFNLTLTGIGRGPIVRRARLDIEPGQGCSSAKLQSGNRAADDNGAASQGPVRGGRGNHWVRLGQPPVDDAGVRTGSDARRGQNCPARCDTGAARLGAGRRGRHGDRRPGADGDVGDRPEPVRDHQLPVHFGVRALRRAESAGHGAFLRIRLSARARRACPRRHAGEVLADLLARARNQRPDSGAARLRGARSRSGAHPHDLSRAGRAGRGAALRLRVHGAAGRRREAHGQLTRTAAESARRVLHRRARVPVVARDAHLAASAIVELRGHRECPGQDVSAGPLRGRLESCAAWTGLFDGAAR